MPIRAILDPDSEVTSPSKRLLSIEELEQTIRSADMAEGMYERLMDKIISFQKALRSDEEVGACLAFFGREITIHIRDLGFQNPQLIIIYGVNDRGQDVELVLHMSQVSILLTPVKVVSGNVARRIGFHTDDAGRQAATGATPDGG